jgi:hypothetical protein
MGPPFATVQRDHCAMEGRNCASPALRELGCKTAIDQDFDVLGKRVDKTRERQLRKSWREYRRKQIAKKREAQGKPPSKYRV